MVAVLSGNRNFEGRIHPLVRASYLASPPLVVAFALAGTVERRSRERLPRHDRRGAHGVPSRPLAERRGGATGDRDRRSRAAAVRVRVRTDLRRRRSVERTCRPRVGRSTRGTRHRRTSRSLPSSRTSARRPASRATSLGARCLVWVGDSITTDHISPAGSIRSDSPAGRHLIGRGVEPRDFNSYGARRGNHEVMMRGTFANVRLRNRLAPGTEGPWTKHLPDGEVHDDLRRVAAVPRRGCAAHRRRRARSTAAGRAATGRPRARRCSAYGPCSPRATSGSTARTSSAWAWCRCSSRPRTRPRRWA